MIIPRLEPRTTKDTQCDALKTTRSAVPADGSNYTPTLKQKLVEISNSIQFYHTSNQALINEALDLVRNPSDLVYVHAYLRN